MGSPLGPVLANVFMGYHEKNWIQNYQNNKPLFYTRYVDDIFYLFEKEIDSELFLEYINSQHPNIQFTIEKELDGKLSFLDTTVDRNQGKNPSTSIFRKLTFTGLMINYLSYNPICYKLAMVKTLIHRVYSICNSKKNFDSDITDLKHILQRNLFPPKVIDEQIKTYLDKTKAKDNENDVPVRSFYKLPYLCDISEKTKKQINKIAEKFCKENVIRLSFNTFKIGSLFSAKDKFF